MGKAEERLQAMLAQRKKEKERENIEKKEVVIYEDNGKENLKKVIFFEDNIFSEIEKDNETIEFLKEKSLELLSIQSKNVIMLGKNLTEVFEELGKKGSPEGVYLKYLEFNGYKKDTALRLRKRYELFKRVKNNDLRSIITLLPVKSIELLYKNQEEFISLLDKKNKNLTYTEVVEILNSNIEKQALKSIPVFEIVYDNEKINILYQKMQNTYKTLDKTKKEKLNKLLFEIEKVLN